MVRTFRWAPLWPAFVLLPFWAVTFFVVVTSSSRRTAVWTAPLFLLMGAAAAIFLNRTRVKVRAEGIEVSNGPVPFTMPDYRLKLSEVESCYSRRVVRGARGGGDYFAAGVKTRSGREMDILAPLATAEEAHEGSLEMARLIAGATQQGLDCTRYGAKQIAEDRRPALRLVGWALAFAAALALAVAGEIAG